MRHKTFMLSAILLLAVVISGCCGRVEKPAEERVVARINNYKMTVDDFKDELKHTFFNEKGQLGNEAVLDLAIKRELLVQEAQRLGLDKRASFMRTIERYWKQTLIKELLEKKTKEIFSAPGLKTQEKNDALAKWYEQLYNKARIEKNRKLLEEIK